MKKSARQSGQVLVLVLLSLSVVLTLVLFILSRTITDISTSTISENSARAFSAAEAGIEKALVIGAGSSGTIGDANFSSQVSSFAEGLKSVNYPVDLLAGESARFWFVSHDSNGGLTCGAGKPCFSGDRIKVCWGKPGTSADNSYTPAIEVSVFYNNSGVRIGRVAYDPNASRRSQNFFAAPDAGSCVIEGVNYAFGKTINFADLSIPSSVYAVDNGLILVQVRMLYNSDKNQSLGLDVNFPGNDTLPSQGVLISSTGSAGEANRRVEVFQSFGTIPSIFDSVVYSEAGITK